MKARLLEFVQHLLVAAVAVTVAAVIWVAFQQVIESPEGSANSTSTSTTLFEPGA